MPENRHETPAASESGETLWAYIGDLSEREREVIEAVNCAANSRFEITGSPVSAADATLIACSFIEGRWPEILDQEKADLAMNVMRKLAELIDIARTTPEGES